MPSHTPADWDRLANRRQEPERRWLDDIHLHDEDPFAHGQLIDRLLTGAAPLRAGIESRLRALEVRVFAGTVIGSIVLVVVGVTLGAVLTHWR